MNGHTPLPWFTVKPDDTRDIAITDAQPLDDAGRCGFGVNWIAHVHPVSMLEEHTEANAKFICRACNSHDDLLEALERLLDGVANWITRGVTDEDMELAKRAIAKAKGETCEPTG